MERINARVERMFASGLPDEVQRIAAGRGFGREAGQALGYRELLEADSVEAAREQVQLHTRQFARRQMTWFRRFEQIRWLTGQDVRALVGYPAVDTVCSQATVNGNGGGYRQKNSA